MFESRLILEADDRPDQWIVRGPLVWNCRACCGRVEVPAGMPTDLASIPRLFRNLPGLDPNGRSRRAAVLHDYLYRTHCARFTRARADRTLRLALTAEGVNWFTRWVIWGAVRVFGWACWG